MDLLIFDCDGVLVDSERLSNRVFAAMLTEEGWPTTPEQSVERYMGRTISSCLDEVAGQLGHPLRSDFSERYYERIFEIFDRELVAVPGIEGALDALGAWPMCVASSGPHRKIRHTLGLTGLLPRFDGRIYSGTEVAEGKPAPDLFLLAAERMGVAPERCIVVEDSVNGVVAARRAGMAVLGFARDTDPARLADAGATVFREMGELPAEIAKCA